MSFRFPKKRGQVTIFIVIGIILLFSSALIFYIRNQIASTTTETQVLDTTTDVPQRADPINAYTRDCLEKVAVKAIRLIGEQGGYIDFKKAGLKHRSARPTMSDMLEVAPGSGYFVPYWHHMPARDTCTLDCYTVTKVPPLTKAEGRNSIEEQLENYISENIKACLNSFKPFKEEGYAVKEEGEPSADVTIARNDVYVELKYPLQFTKEDATSKYETFSVRVPFELRRAYELATYIMNKSVELELFESDALNLIAAFSGLKSDMLPPIYDIDFEGGQQIFWQKSAAEKKVKQILMSHIPMIRFMGTRNYYSRELEDLIVQGMSYKMIVGSERAYPEFNVDFSYLAWWPTYFDIKPSRGEIIKPEANSLSFMNSILPGFGINQYKFFYDLSFPVLVTVSYPEAFNGKGFSLNYAIEANIRQNWPVNGSMSLGRYSSAATLACDNPTSGNITITVTDASTGTGVNGVPVYFRLSRNEACLLGKTTGNGTLAARMPSGIGAVVIEAPPQFGGTITKPYSVYPGKNDSLSFALYPKHRLKVKVKKMRIAPVVKLVTTYEAPSVAELIAGGGFGAAIKTQASSEQAYIVGWNFQPNASFDLNSYQNAMVNVEQFKKYAEEEGVSSATMAGANSSDDIAFIEIVPGNYSVQLQLMSHKEYKIPEQYKYVCEPFFCLSKKKQTIPGMTLPVLTNGGLLFDNETGLWEVKPDKLYSSDAITFFVVETDFYSLPEPARSVEDLEMLNAYEEVSKKYRSQLEPVWS